MPTDAVVTEAEAQAPEPTPADLLDNLRDLGTALPVSLQPTAADMPLMIAGLSYYLATGSLIAPVVAAPDPIAAQAAEQEQSRIAELETQLAESNRKAAAAGVGPAAVAPAPIAAAAEPEPVAPAEPAAEPTPSPEDIASAQAVIAAAEAAAGKSGNTFADPGAGA